MAAGLSSSSSRRRDLINVARLVDRLELGKGISSKSEGGTDAGYYHALAMLSVRGRVALCQLDGRSLLSLSCLRPHAEHRLRPAIAREGCVAVTRPGCSYSHSATVSHQMIAPNATNALSTRLTDRTRYDGSAGPGWLTD